MSAVLSKFFLEEYARLSLVSLCGFDKNNLFRADRPDIQSRDGSVGIEVTWDIYKEEMKFRRKIEEIWNVLYDKIPPKKLERLLKFYKIKVENNRIKGASMKDAVTENTPAHLRERVFKKIDLLQRGNYEKSEEYQLYVYIDSVLLDGCESYTVSLLDEIQRNPCEKHSKIYFNQYYLLYVCDIKNGEYQRLEIPNELREQLRLEALDNISTTS